MDNQCVPLYDTVIGLDLNIKVAITPSQTIPDNISEVFVDNLKQMADTALSDSVRLKRRQLSLWYLPRSNANPTEYYLLDVFLFSPSNVTKYSDAVGQVKQFFRIMKAGDNFAILEALNIKLNFQFKHGLRQRTDTYLDMSNGQTLKPLMEKEWTLTIPGPHMTISEVNWCFRTVFELTEIEVFGDQIHVKSTDILLFIDQIDTLQPQMYICIDMFIKQRNVEEDFQINQVEKTLTDDDDGDDDDDDTTLSGEIVIDSERGLILTVSMISVILLLVILYRVKNAKARKQIEESATSYQPPSDFVELNVISYLNTLDRMSLNDIDVEINAKFGSR